MQFPRLWSQRGLHTETKGCVPHPQQHHLLPLRCTSHGQGEPVLPPIPVSRGQMPYHRRLGWCHVRRGGSGRPKTYYQPCPTPLRHSSSFVALTPILRSGHEHSRLVLNEAFRPNYVDRTHDLGSSAAEIHQAPFAHYLDALQLR